MANVRRMRARQGNLPQWRDSCARVPTAKRRGDDVNDRPRKWSQGSDREWAEQIARLDDVATAARHAQRRAGVTCLHGVATAVGRAGARGANPGTCASSPAACTPSRRSAPRSTVVRLGRRRPLAARKRRTRTGGRRGRRGKMTTTSKARPRRRRRRRWVRSFLSGRARPRDQAPEAVRAQIDAALRRAARREPRRRRAPRAAARPSTPHAPRIVSADISRGREPRVRIECVDDTGAPHATSAAPPPFTYVAASVEGSAARPAARAATRTAARAAARATARARGATAIAVAVYGARAAAGAAAGRGRAAPDEQPGLPRGLLVRRRRARRAARSTSSARRRASASAGWAARARASARARARDLSPSVVPSPRPAFVSPFALQGTYSRSARRACGSTSSRSTSATTRAAATRGSAGTASCSAA